MTMNRLSVAILGILVLLCGYYCDLGLSYRDEGFIRMNLGGVRDRDCLHCLQNSAEINGLARFAVQEHNKKQNALLEFVRVLEAEEQVVAGKLYHLTLLVMDDGNKEFYEAKVLVTPWMHFKQLQEFKHAEGVHPWQPVPTNDPLVQDAANHAIQTIQQRSNSLIPYELLEILKAKAKVIEGNAKFDLRLRVKWGIKEENLRVKLIRTVEGKFFYFKIVQ